MHYKRSAYMYIEIQSGMSQLVVETFGAQKSTIVARK